VCGVNSLARVIRLLTSDEIRHILSRYMSKEREGQPVPGIPLTGIYLDIPSRTVAFATETEVVASLRLTETGIVFEARQHSGHTMLVPEMETVASPAAVEPAPEARRDVSMVETEKPKAVTLQGKLKSKPREGRPDSRGHATSWARFAAHEEESEGAHLYSATFHKHTAAIARRLDKDMPLTVQGFPHQTDDPGSKRMDTLSVINLLDYPGKPQK